MGGALAEQGLAKDEVIGVILELKKQNIPTYGPRMFRPSYFAGEDVVDVAESAFVQFIKENWLYGRTSYPAVGQFEDDILETLKALFHAPEKAGGVLTSGGTESLILSVKIARDCARAAGKAEERFNVVLPHTAHPGFTKAADLLGLEERRAPSSVNYLADVQWMTEACDVQTIMVVGSAPPYPFGQTDPIEALSDLAQERGLWLHVDACLGGMILPFLSGVGAHEPAFDFRIAGVSSISVDLHKFGYASKGISALMLRERQNETHAGTVFTDWPSGLYATPGIAGTRSAGSLASAWAVMRYLGREGFIDRTAKIIRIRNAFIAGLQTIGGQIFGRPDGFHFNFVIEGVDSLALAEALTDEGWIVASTQGPDSVQLMITAAHKGMATEFCARVTQLADEIRRGERAGTGKGAVYSAVSFKE